MLKISQVDEYCKTHAIHYASKIIKKTKGFAIKNKSSGLKIIASPIEN